MSKILFKNTIMELYPSYAKKAILNKLVEEGFVINNKKFDGQFILNFNNSVDVTDDDSIDKKIEHALENDSVLNFIEEYEFKKTYRYFCYFKYKDVSYEAVERLVQSNDIYFFDKRNLKFLERYDKPLIYLYGDEIYFKFTTELKNDENSIKYTVIAIFDKQNEILEFRYDPIGIEYKKTYSFYKDKIAEIINYFKKYIGLEIENIDFKALINYIKDRDDITIYAKRMTRNGTTAYLEAFEDEESIIPILGELDKFIEDNSDLFETNDVTRDIKEKLKGFIKDIDVKSDMPKAKIRLDKSGIKFGVTHNYQDTEYSMFMIYGELVGEKETMNNVKGYLMQRCREFDSELSVNSLSAGTM